MPAGANSAVYMVLRNEGSVPDQLVGAESSVAGAVEIHESRMVDDVMGMVEVGAVEVPSGGVVRLEPGGLHVMLLNLSSALSPGDTLELSLHFQVSGPQILQVPVRAPSGG
jgi:copper(I)-binding protein